METEFNCMGFPQLIIMADMNNLKKTNDLYGHHMGDLLIQKCSKIFGARCFDNALIFRMGGDEFLILYAGNIDTQIEDKIDLANEIASNTSISDGTSTIKGLSIAMGASSRQSIDDDFNEKMMRLTITCTFIKFIKSIAKS